MILFVYLASLSTLDSSNNPRILNVDLHLLLLQLLLQLPTTTNKSSVVSMKARSPDFDSKDFSFCIATILHHH